jgi:hypothetical protein
MRAATAALLGALLPVGPMLVGTMGAALAASPVWQLTVTQFDKAGTLVGAPLQVSCPETGCQQVIPLDVLGKSKSFLLGVTFVQRGVYVALQAREADVGKVIEFEKGFDGPIFSATHKGIRTTVRLRFTLTGEAVSTPEQDLMMRNSRSLVFHRKMDPDITLKVDIDPPVKPRTAAPGAG